MPTPISTWAFIGAIDIGAIIYFILCYTYRIVVGIFLAFFSKSMIITMEATGFCKSFTLFDLYFSRRFLQEITTFNMIFMKRINTFRETGFSRMLFTRNFNTLFQIPTIRRLIYIANCSDLTLLSNFSTFAVSASIFAN